MRIVFMIVACALSLAAGAPLALDHGDAPHPKCKKGYVLTDDHKCVKADG